MHHYFLTLMNEGGPLCTIQRLKLVCNKLLLSFAFNFDLRRYIKGLRGGPLDRLRETAQQLNKGKGAKPERARNVLRELVGVGEQDDK